MDKIVVFIYDDIGLGIYCKRGNIQAFTTLLNNALRYGDVVVMRAHWRAPQHLEILKEEFYSFYYLEPCKSSINAQTKGNSFLVEVMMFLAKQFMVY